MLTLCLVNVKIGYPMLSDLHLNEDFGRAIFDADMHIPNGIVGPDGKAAPVRFGVYRNNVIVSLIDAMRDAYPSVLAILGEENFARVARISLTC